MALILIVEDQEEMRDLYRLMLEHLGHEVMVAEHGLDGLYGLKRHPDLVILDLQMPVASGDVVLGFIRSTPGITRTRVLVISAHPEALTLSRQLEADGCLMKPVGMDEVTEAVNRLLAEATAG